MIKRDETDRAGAGRADPVAEDSFQDQRHDDRAPADENGRRIKICDRRSLLQIHARDQPKGVNREGKQQQIKRRAVEWLGSSQAMKRKRAGTRGRKASCFG